MWDSVKAFFPVFSAHFEGRCRYMYPDIRGLVSGGIGALFDPISLCTYLPWLNSDNSPASNDDIVGEWNAMKQRGRLYTATADSWKTYPGGGHFGQFATLHLTDESIDDLLQSKADFFDRHLCTELPGYEQFPAEAQLALLSMLWALGTLSGYPLLRTALASADWPECSRQAHIRDADNPGVRPRNAANAALFLLAAQSDDPSVLHYGAADLP